jgi:2,3-bisphosphoglycerate-dependent phosphoglycerate mutase
MKLLLLGHGGSIWNLEDRFTGWTDVDLSARGITEAEEMGKNLRYKGYFFIAKANLSYSSFQR